MPSLVTHYRRYDITNYAEIFHFGTTSLLNLNPFSALTKIARPTMENTYHDTTNVIEALLGHPIQIYSNENTTIRIIQKMLGRLAES